MSKSSEAPAIKCFSSRFGLGKTDMILRRPQKGQVAIVKCSLQLRERWLPFINRFLEFSVNSSAQVDVGGQALLERLAAIRV